MTSSASSGAGEPPDRRQALFSEYEMVVESHDKITDFRAKLLALLPIASGAGAGFLISQTEGEVSDTAAALIIALGVFGLVVTFGLFMYELRQIDVCKQLRNHAAWLEREMEMSAGQFGARRGRLSLREIYVPRHHRARDDRYAKAERAGEVLQQAPARARPLVKRPLAERPLIGAESAGYVVYHAVMAAWLVVAIVGIVDAAS
jgi:hypothetical protein